MDMHDVIIIGGGSAGISAALTLGRSRRQTLLLDADAPRNASANAMHNYPAHDGDAPLEFRARGLEQALAYPGITRIEAHVDAVQSGEAGFVVEAAGESYAARRILFATGLRDNLPDFEVLRAAWGNRVFHCPYCHGYETTGSRVAVLGEGDHRFRMALLMSRYARELVWVANQSATEAMVPALEKAGVQPVRSPLVDIQAAGEAFRLVFSDGSEREVDQILVNNEQVASNDLAAKLGCTLNESGLIRVDDMQRTSVRGVYAAGDCAHRDVFPAPVSSVLMASALGQFGAAMMDHDLLAEDFDLH